MMSCTVVCDELLVAAMPKSQKAFAEKVHSAHRFLLASFCIYFLSGIQLYSMSAKESSFIPSQLPSFAR